MIFWRVKQLDDILATAERKALTRTLGAFQLTMLGIGAIIGTGIFVLTAEAATKAGPAMMVSFVIAATVCALAALCYAEIASMIPVSGSAYTYSYGTMGELVAWVVGWALVLEYAIAASAVSVGWSGYMVRLVEEIFNVVVPTTFTNGPFDKTPGLINLPAFGIALLVTVLHAADDRRHDRPAHLLEVDVHAFRCQPVQRGAHILRLVVDRVIEPQLLRHEAALVRPAGDPDHLAALELADLPHDLPDAAGGSAHHQRLARLGLADVQQAEIGRRPHHAKGAEGLRDADPRQFREQRHARPVRHHVRGPFA